MNYMLPCSMSLAIPPSSINAHPIFFPSRRFQNSKFRLTPLQSAFTQTAPATPLECYISAKSIFKSFGMIHLCTPRVGVGIHHRSTCSQLSTVPFRYAYQQSYCHHPPLPAPSIHDLMCTVPGLSPAAWLRGPALCPH